MIFVAFKLKSLKSENIYKIACIIRMREIMLLH